MEPNHERQKTSVFAHEDVIGNMPDNVITNILYRLPLQDAVRTGILARNWRFKWTLLISQLVFDEDFFEYLRETKAENDGQVRVIVSRILFQLRGAITKCVLEVYEDMNVEDEDIIHWISFLSGKGINNFTLEYFCEPPFKLPTHLFSCLELKHLKLRNCCFNPPPTFHGFPNLLSLELDEANGKLGGVITRCPLLEILKLDGVSYMTCKLKLDEIARLDNLKILSLSLCNLDTMMKFHSSSTIFELLGSLPKLQEFELDFLGYKLLEGVASNRFSIAFPCLKTLILSSIYLEDGMKLSCAFELISSCPNLQTLEITTNWDIGPAPLEDYNTTGLLQLRSVMFEYLKGSENELCLLKYLLVSSPFLKQVVIHSHSHSKITSDGKLKFANKLLKLHRASPVVDISLF